MLLKTLIYQVIPILRSDRGTEISRHVK